MTGPVAGREVQAVADAARSLAAAAQGLHCGRVADTATVGGVDLGALVLVLQEAAAALEGE